MNETNISKLLGILGLSHKAGKLAIGTESVIESMRKGKCCLVIVSTEVSERTMKQITDKADYYRKQCIKADISMERLASSLGRRICSAVALTDKAFLPAIGKYIDICEKG